ncbi:hypothetical protein Tco_0290470, partial [Tanacetum coccineum]
YSVENFDGAYLGRYDPIYYTEYFKGKPLRVDESDMIWLSYMTKYIRTLKEAKNFVTFCFDEIEGIEVKMMGVRLVCDEDSNQEEDMNKLQDLPSLSQHGGASCLTGLRGYRTVSWSW